MLNKTLFLAPLFVVALFFAFAPKAMAVYPVKCEAYFTGAVE